VAWAYKDSQQVAWPATPQTNFTLVHIFADIELSNPRKPESRSIAVHALADTGARMLCLPEHLAIQLELETETTREVTIADGRSIKVPYAGPIKVRFENRICYVGGLVMGDEVLLGAVPMEDMDLVLTPSKKLPSTPQQAPISPMRELNDGPDKTLDTFVHFVANHD
jgi:clan AA aspartic protease